MKTIHPASAEDHDMRLKELEKVRKGILSGDCSVRDPFGFISFQCY